MSGSRISAVLAAFDGGHMDGGWIAVGAVLMVAMMSGMGWMMWSMMRHSGSDGETTAQDPVALLRARYARGELTTEEFHERLRTLEGQSGTSAGSPDRRT